jgi:formate dehydrogenase subunit gamma
MSERDRLIIMDGQVIERYRPSDCFNHWLIALTFILLALSGLALFHPSMFWLTALFGGGQWTRILHPWIGVVMFVAFLLFSLRFARDNGMGREDWRWLGRIRDVVTNREENLPEMGRYNAGQKVLFWVLVVLMLALLLSGIVIWYEYFAPYFTVGQRRVAAVVHAVAAFLIILGIIVHIYSAYWLKGSIPAMTRGTVTRAWARKHHPAWYREVTGGAK